MKARRCSDIHACYHLMCWVIKKIMIRFRDCRFRDCLFLFFFLAALINAFQRTRQTCTANPFSFIHAHTMPLYRTALSPHCRLGTPFFLPFSLFSPKFSARNHLRLFPPFLSYLPPFLSYLTPLSANTLILTLPPHPHPHQYPRTTLE